MSGAIPPLLHMSSRRIQGQLYLLVSFSLEREVANSKSTWARWIILKFKVGGPHVILINKEEIFIKLNALLTIFYTFKDTVETYCASTFVSLR
jgi:hypothetical protein